MMSIRSARPRRLLPALLAVLALAAGFALPPAPAAATVTPTWIGYAVVADFNASQPKLTYTVFGGTDGPPATVYEYDSVDLIATEACTFTDITYSGGYAQFNGSSSKIECTVPSFAEKIAELFPDLDPLENKLTCTCGGAPLWASADAILDPVSGEQPVANLLNAADNGIAFRLTSNGVRARTVIDMPGAADLIGPLWNIAPSASRVLMGVNGPSIIALDDEFGWLHYLDPAWKSAFEPVAATARHWFEPPIRVNWVTSPTSYNLFTNATQLTIGHNPVTGSSFDGQLRFMRLDPGCPSF